MTKHVRADQIGNRPDIGPVIDLQNPGRPRQDILYEMYKRGELPPRYYGLPDYPEGKVIGPCVCGGWPGGKCFRCKIVVKDNYGNNTPRQV
jgi:hypothetical protein